MLTVIDYDRIRRAYHLEEKSMRQIERELGHGYWTIRKALDASEPSPYRLTEPRAAPVLGPYKAEIDKRLAEEKGLPRKQRYTSKKLYELIQAQGYKGAESTVRVYVGKRRQAFRRPPVYLPLVFEPGQDAQIDWGVGWVEMAERQVQVQLFVLRLCYSRKIFVMAFPTQRTEAFFLAHVKAFRYLGGVPRRLSYDNLTTAVKASCRDASEKNSRDLWPCAAITCSKAASVRRAKAMRKDGSRMGWAMCNATSWFPCSK